MKSRLLQKAIQLTACSDDKEKNYEKLFNVD